ncbi:MAG: Valyl-tRNA synthetase [Candidatus Bipolaricaulis sibiricus]|uniref:Valine--tRNA ligase n=1 Tax=Bipolaricaulis sibiricus TaxID=2501609 RepID=A0A410FU13_BIPS1|nr:MAG: Valyl-tRNA synthetase [Candidatus Bipolaricaulis sibiricus]
MLPPRYDPTEVEPRILTRWEQADLWRCDPRSGKPPYSIVIPPPNITGRLHLGHNLVYTLQDLLIRYKRMAGFEACWFPGTDHAGIATQNVVEKALAREGTTRQALGREGFERRVWEWKERYGNEIVDQLKILGCSCDWSRQRFTLDAGLSRAVVLAFVRLHGEGLIYRGDYMIQWCPRCGTALSDIEVEHAELDGHLYHIRYPLEGGGYVTVATTRPETMLGDTGVAVNPRDERYSHLIGKTAVLPLLGRRLPIVGADEVDPQFGTGVLKITPGHDPVDREIGKRHGLPAIDILNPNGTINDHGGPFAGLDRFAAREEILHRLKADGLLEKAVPYRHAVGHCQRCQTRVEPKISTQWFVRMKPLAEPAIDAVRAGRIRFVPERWAKVYFDWLEGIRDWCISRQLWWGHRIPAWYGPDGEAFIARDEAEARVLASRHYGRAVPLRQDEDVLDTWFSSALWPFSVMGWPEETVELRTFYPTSVLVTAFDILFFWVARMVMMGLHFMNEVPFRDVLITPFIVDEHGQKMSRSRGNMIDALEVKETHGMDALRFTMAGSSTKGRDMSFSMRQVDEARNFQNKLWNMARFILTNTEDLPPEAVLDGRTLAPEDRWLRSRLSRVVDKVRTELDRYNFHLATDALYHFVWHELCDWYVELAKLRLQGEDAEARTTCQLVLREALEIVVRLLHPIMPFLTEELWGHMGGTGMLARADFPRSRPEWNDPEAERQLDRLMQLVREVRAVRAEVGVPAGTEVDLVLVSGAGAEDLATLFAPAVRRLARAATVRYTPGAPPPAGAARGVAGEVAFFLPVGDLVDWGAVRERVRRDLEKTTAELDRLEGRLANPQFRGKAAPEVVAKAEAEAAELRARRARLERYLED